MSGSALLLVVAASSIHVAWNLMTKRSANRLIFLWLGLGAGLLIYAPLAIWLAWREPILWRGLGFAAVSGTIHTAYYYALSRMYAHEFSLTYPTARGISPVLVTIASLTLLHEPLRLGGLAGIAGVVVGVGFLRLRVLSLAGAHQAVSETIHHPAGRLALVTGVLIASYSLVDKIGVSMVDPVLYLWCTHLVAFLIYSPTMIRNRAVVTAEASSASRSLLVVGIGQNLAYILVLNAMRLAPVAYVVPAREVSTLIGVIVGTLVLKEPAPLPKLAGAVVIVAGVALISLKG
jgi:drug/metabolite transporter (DMT)-like permease